MVRKYISEDTLFRREQHLIPQEPNEYYMDESAVTRSLNFLKENGRESDDSLFRYFNEAASNTYYGNKNAEKCIQFLSEAEQNGLQSSNTLLRLLTNDILPACLEFKAPKDAIRKSSLNESEKEILEAAISEYELCSRVLNNNKKLSKRFDFIDKVHEAGRSSIEEFTESVCSLVDTYDMPLDKKYNIALEETLYLYFKSGIPVDQSHVVEAVNDYFLMENDLITDTEMKGIRKVLCNNPFITESNIENVRYMMEGYLFSDKINAICESGKVKNPKFKELLKKAGDCRVAKTAKGIIADALSLIISSFVIGAIVAFSEVVILIAGLFAMIINIAAHTKELLTILIKGESDIRAKIETADNSSDAKRYKQVADELKKNIDKVQNSDNPVKESATIVDQALLDDDGFSPSVMVIHEPEPEFAFNMIKDIVSESKDFADSDDVKELLKKFNAEQNKTQGKFKTVMTKIFAKKPADIIDETPSILKVLRMFFVFGSLAIPAKAIAFPVAMILFFTDKYLSMDLNRKQMEAVLKAFDKEKEIIDAKLDKEKNPDKIEDLEEYRSCLDKAYEKLEDYRDNLYSEKELDKIKGYDEAANVSIMDKITVQEYFDKYHQNVCTYVDHAAQIFKSRYVGTCSADLEEFECEEGESKVRIHDKLRNINPETLTSNFVTPDGIINIPMFVVKPEEFTPELMSQITDICSYTNQYISDKCMVSNNEIDNKIFITFNFLQALELTPEEQENTEENVDEELEEAMANLYFFEAAVDEITSYSPSTIVSELCRNIDLIVHEDVSDIVSLLNIANIDYSSFEESLKDYRFICKDSSICNNIDEALMIKESPIGECYIKESMMNQLTALEYLDSIVTEAKKVKEEKKPSGGIIRAVKDKFTKKKDDSDELKDKQTWREKLSKNSAVKGATEKSAAIKGKAHTEKEIASSKISGIKDKTAAKYGRFKNNMALTGEVIKKNIVKAGNKEKEISRDIDITTANLKKGIQKALTSDRREAIIKGSIIPSFSKLIKLGIAGAGLFAINPALGGITAFTYIITSKLLNNKEKNLLLDEIKVELDVVEKELEAADRDGDTAKYRKLLTFKRKLNRERQRLEYGLKTYQSNRIDPDL